MARSILCVAIAVTILLAGVAAKPPEPPVLNGPVEEEYHSNGCCHGGLYPVCRRVSIVKKKPHIEYTVKCEPVCVPGCSLLDGCRDGCSCSNVRIREKKTLLKKITEKETASYEYKIVWVCRACAFGPGCCDEVSR